MLILHDSCSGWSATRRFTLDSPLTAPVLASPTPDTTQQPIPVLLTWQDIAGGAAGFVALAEPRAGGVLADTVYAWQVRACTGAGCSPWSQPGWVFATETTAVPTVLARYYYLRDHLGSVRATVDEVGAVVHHDDYYPFGAPMTGRGMDEQGQAPRERFTGHELEEDIDSNEKATYYAGARYYDGLIGRWNAVDPKDYLFPSHSPYNYVFNNPIKTVDPDGECPPCTPEQTAFLAGGYSYLKSSVLGALDAIRHPIRTAEAIGSLNTPTGQAVAAMSLIEAGQRRVDLVKSGSLGQAFVAGEATAAIGEAVAGTKGAGLVVGTTGKLANGGTAVRLARGAGITDDLAPVLLGHNMDDVLRPLAAQEGLATLSFSQGGNTLESLLNNAVALAGEIQAGRRVLFLANGSTSHTLLEKLVLKLTGRKKVKAGTRTIDGEEVDVFEYVPEEE